MEEKKSKTFISITPICIILAFIAYKFGYHRGDYEGYKNGYNEAFDTIVVILNSQSKLDSTATAIAFVDKDTDLFIINKKHK